MEIPIIEPEGEGYFEIYENEKIWHDERELHHIMKFNQYKEVGEKYGVGAGNWMNLEQGENKIRIVSNFEDYGNHFDSISKKSTVCIGKDEGCEYCKLGQKPRVQFLGWVIDRKNNEVKLLRIGFQIHRAIGELATSDEYGFDDTPDYDMTIKKEGEGLDTEYHVIPARKNTALTVEESNEINAKVKDPREIIEKMQAKVAPKKEEIIEEEEVDVKDIPF
jgi:hypothetical protein